MSKRPNETAEKVFQVGGIDFAAVRKAHPRRPGTSIWLLKIVESGQELEPGTGGVSNGSVPKLKKDLEYLFERISKGSTEDFRRRWNLPVTPLRTEVEERFPKLTLQEAADRLKRLVVGNAGPRDHLRVAEACAKAGTLDEALQSVAAEVEHQIDVDDAAQYIRNAMEGSLPLSPSELMDLYSARGETSGSVGKHDWCIGRPCGDGIAVFVDDRQLSYRPTLAKARAYAMDVIGRLQADGDYRLNDRPQGFLPPKRALRAFTYGDGNAIMILAGQQLGLSPSCVDVAMQYLTKGGVFPSFLSSLEKEAVQMNDAVRKNPSLLDKANAIATDLKVLYGFIEP